MLRFSILCFLFTLRPSSALSSSAQTQFGAMSSSTTNKSIGAQAMKNLVIDAAKQNAAESLDLSGILWLEHINLVVGSRSLAEKFYFDVLGFSKDKSSSFHCNLGQQQFHLAENGDPSQRVTGSIGLVVPSVDRIRQRARSALEEDEAFRGTCFEILHDDGATLSLSCPWGNVIHLYDETTEAANLQPISDSPHKMVKFHAEGGTYAPERMAVRGQPGIRYIEIACRKGTASGLADFYRDMLGCQVSTPLEGQAVVCVGPGVHLAYIEDETLTDSDEDTQRGVHICIYVNNFRSLYQRLSAKNLIWTNPRFTHLDSCDT